MERYWKSRLIRSGLLRSIRVAFTAFLLLGLLTGCGQTLEDWVRSVRPNFGVPVKFEGQSNVKISPGTTISTDGQVSARTHITITDRPMTSADVSARVSINRTRTEGLAP